MMLALYRMSPFALGKILLDGRDIGPMGLNDVRSAVSIIPQEPVLFTGTVRTNLDPFNEYTDAHLWDVLEKANLKGAIDALPQKLNSTVAENGENFSVGQRQLMCLARALTKRAKLLILDEATANVDFETDAIIQRTVRDNFQDCTRLTIAHRLNTIVDSDKILVLDKGCVGEFDTPRNLVLNKASLLNSMIEETGPANAEALRRVALGEANRKIIETKISDSKEIENNEIIVGSPIVNAVTDSGKKELQTQQPIEPIELQERPQPIEPQEQQPIEPQEPQQPIGTSEPQADGSRTTDEQDDQ